MHVKSEHSVRESASNNRLLAADYISSVMQDVLLVTK